MNVFLTEHKNGQPGPHILAESWNDAQEKVDMLIERIMLPPGLEVCGELVETIELKDLGIDSGGIICDN